VTERRPSGRVARVQGRPAATPVYHAIPSEGDGLCGVNYGEIRPGKEPGATAAGLLCRLLLGWKKDNPAIQRGVKYLSELGPSKTDAAMDFFATQVMRPVGGDAWTPWNRKLRDPLVQSQKGQGHEEGSWPPTDVAWSKPGGRLYQTVFNLAALEVYYRYLAIYREQDVDEAFPEQPDKGKPPEARE